MVVVGALIVLIILGLRRERELRRLRRVTEDLAASEQHQRTLVEHAPEGILELDATTRLIVGVHGNATRILRRGKEALTGKSIADISSPVQPDGRSSAAAAGEGITDALSGHSPAFEWHFVDSQGKGCPTEIRLARMPGSSRIRASVTDITERVRARQVLEESEARFRTLVEYATEAIVLLDVETMSFSEINPNAAELFGYTRGSLLALRPIDLFPRFQPDGRTSAAFMEEAMQEVLEGRRLVETDVVGRRANGELFNVSLRSVLLPGGRPQVRSTIIDVTDHIRKEGILQAAKDEAEKANRAKTAFLAHMSHEIRTPMNGVLGMLGLLMDSHLTEDQRQSAELAKSSAESLLAILNDVLDISKIEAGQFELERIPFDLHRIVNSVVAMLVHRASENGVEILCRVDPGVPRHVVGDPHRLRQILSNLVSNAVKFTQDGEVVVRLTREGQTDAEVGLGFAIRDTGTGIPRDRLESIFEPFVQADASVTRRFGGTGLGLAICRQLVNLMGGTLSVESEPGRGSEFRFSLTLRRAVGQSGADGGPAGANFSGQRVLTVNSSPTSRRLVREALESVGLRITEAPDVYSALRAGRIALAEEDPFALAIVDDSLPGEGGLEFVRGVGADRNLRDLRLVLLTVADDRAVPRKAGAPGASACLVKPVSRADLLDCVNAVLGAPEPGRMTEGVMEESRRNLKILLAEDNAVNQRVATSMLKKRGHEVDVVENGLAAVEAVGTRAYDVVLMDVQMPKLDGLDATRRIRGAGFRDLRIVALTAHATTDDRDRCIEAGMSDFLTMPFESCDLFRAVEGEIPPPGAATREPAGDPVDLAAFTRSMRDAGVGEIVDETLRAYLQDSPGCILRLKEAMASGDSEGVGKAAHAFKSSSAAIGATGLATLLGRMESAGKTGEAGELGELMARVLGLYQAVVHQLEGALTVET